MTSNIVGPNQTLHLTAAARGTGVSPVHLRGAVRLFVDSRRDRQPLGVSR